MKSFCNALFFQQKQNGGDFVCLKIKVLLVKYVVSFEQLGSDVHMENPGEIAHEPQLEIKGLMGFILHK